MRRTKNVLTASPRQDGGGIDRQAGERQESDFGRRTSCSVTNNNFELLDISIFHCRSRTTTEPDKFWLPVRVSAQRRSAYFGAPAAQITRRNFEK